MKQLEATPALTAQQPSEDFDPEVGSEPWPEAFDPASIDHDESLILWMLEKTPTERLEVLQDFTDAVMTLRNGRKVSQ